MFAGYFLAANTSEDSVVLKSANFQNTDVLLFRAKPHKVQRPLPLSYGSVSRSGDWLPGLGTVWCGQQHRSRGHAAMLPGFKPASTTWCSALSKQPSGEENDSSQGCSEAEVN